MLSGAALLSVYRGATRLLQPLAPLLLRRRLARGKEHETRWRERMGKPSLARPPGRLAWLHGASVGESLALLPLVQALASRGYGVLVTSGTVTSAAILERRLPPGSFHQFAPLDVPAYLTAFMAHWRPDLALIAESEIWPNMLAIAHERRIPVILVNGRMSPRSFARWLKAPSLAAALMGLYDLCLARTQADAARFAQLGAPRVYVVGNLKYDVAPPPAESAALADLTARIGSRPVWLAASTHEGEEEIAIAAHRRLAQRFPRLLTIIVPRHAARGGDVAELARQEGFEAPRRSQGGTIGRDTEIYVADTMGELGLFYRAAGLVFMGGSLVPHGGQNPIEPARLGGAILHGPHVANFAEDFELLGQAQGALLVRDASELAAALTALLSDAHRLRAMARAAAETVEKLGGATQRILAALEPYEAQRLVMRDRPE